MNYLQIPIEDRPPLQTRETFGGAIEVLCPACEHWRQGFLIEQLSPDDAELLGVEWACDGERTRLSRAPSASSDEAPPITSLAFIDLFTLAEQLAAYASDDAAVKLTLGQTQAAGIIHLDSPRVADGLDLLVAAGIILPARVAEILAGTPQQ